MQKEITALLVGVIFLFVSLNSFSQKKPSSNSTILPAARFSKVSSVRFVWRFAGSDRVSTKSISDGICAILKWRCIEASDQSADATVLIDLERKFTEDAWGENQRTGCYQVVRSWSGSPYRFPSEVNFRGTITVTTNASPSGSTAGLEVNSWSGTHTFCPGTDGSSLEQYLTESAFSETRTTFRAGEILMPSGIVEYVLMALLDDNPSEDKVPIPAVCASRLLLHLRPCSN